MANRQTIAELLVELQAKTDGFSRKMSGAEKRTQTADRRIGKATKSIKSRFAGVTKVLGKMNGAIAAIGAALATAGIARVGAKALAGADDLQSASAALGISAETLQAVQFKLQESADIAPDKVMKGLERFNKRLGEARTGTGALSDTIERLGIPLKNANGDFRSAEEVLNDVTSAIANANDQADQAEIASAAFGRELAGATQGFAGIGDDINGVIERAKELGRVVENDVIAKAADANDKFQKIGRTLKDGFNAGILEGFTEGLDEVGVDMKSLAGLAREVGSAVGTAMAKMVELVDRIAAIFDRISAMVEFLGLGNSNVGSPGAATVRRDSRDTTAMTAGEMFEQFSSGGSGGSGEEGATGRRDRRTRPEGFASGGAFVVGGASGQDRNLVSFMASRGEKVNISRPGDRDDGGGNGVLDSLYRRLTETLRKRADVEVEVQKTSEVLSESLENAGRAAFRAGFQIEDMARAFLRSFGGSVAGSFTSAGGDLLSKGLSMAASGVLGGGGGGSVVAPGFGMNFGGGTVGFASGGSFRVGGPAGMDNKLVSFKASPGEMVNVSRPGEGGGGTTITNNYSIDARGADQGTVQRLEAVMEEHTRNHDQYVARGVKRSRSERVLGRRG